MLRMILVLLMVALGAGQAQAVEVEGVDLEQVLEVQGQTLQLNGYGIREKFFFDIYIGSLYTAQPVVSTTEALAASGAKLIRMDFLYREVDRGKIVAAFAEGFEKNSPGFAASPAAGTFLGWFTRDFVRDDVVELQLSADGFVRALHNGTRLGSLQSPELARAVLLVYLGDQPADAGLKSGMLGGG